jgi:predicted RNA binding protein YcfA (HicA-like mRNA interferase family)
MFGWEHASTKGSHARFTKNGERSIIVPISNKRVKRFYLDQICIRLGLDVDNETN